jgi:hypothetical protein
LGDFIAYEQFDVEQARPVREFFTFILLDADNGKGRFCEQTGNVILSLPERCNVLNGWRKVVLQEMMCRAAEATLTQITSVSPNTASAGRRGSTLHRGSDHRWG